MRKGRLQMLLYISKVIAGLLLFSNSIFAQSKPKIIFKNEFCDPNRQIDNNEGVQNEYLSVVNAIFLSKIEKALAYNNVYKKIDGSYKIEKCKTKNIHDEEQIDTLIYISDKYELSGFVYDKPYKWKIPAIASAVIAGEHWRTAGPSWNIAGLKYGMGQPEVLKLINAPVNDMRDNSTVYVTDTEGNNYIKLVFYKTGKGKLVLEKLFFKAYWD